MRQTAIATLVALTLALGGCSADAPEAGSLPEGLTVLEATDTSLSVAFRRDDLVVYAEALRGDATPEPYQSDPHSPRFQMDVRFTAGDGYAFYTQQGGDVWLDESWAEDRARQTALPTVGRESNEWMFELATEMARVLPTELEAQLGPDAVAQHEPETSAILTFGRRAHETWQSSVDEFQQMRLREIAIAEGQDPSTVGTVEYGDLGGPDEAWASFASNYYYVEHYIGDISFAWLCGGYHSASRQLEWRGSYWASLHDNANHGRAPSDSSMWRNGLLNYYEAVNDYHPAWTVRTCSTGYDALSNGSGHNCHDDARIQMNNFIYNSTAAGTQYWCNDGDNDADFSCGTEGGHPNPNGDRYEGFNYFRTCQYNYSLGSSCPASYQGTNDGCDCGCRFPDGTWADPDCRY